MNKHNETNLAKVGRILAAAALLIEVNDKIIIKLGEIIGQSISDLAQQLVTELSDEEVIASAEIQHEILIGELKELIKEQLPKSQIVTLN